MWLSGCCCAPCSTDDTTTPPQPSRHGCTGPSRSRLKRGHLKRGRLAPGARQRRRRASGAPPAPALRQKGDAAVRACAPASSAGSAETERWCTAHASPAAENARSAAGHCSSGVSSLPSPYPKQNSCPAEAAHRPRQPRGRERVQCGRPLQQRRQQHARHCARRRGRVDGRQRTRARAGLHPPGPAAQGVGARCAGQAPSQGTRPGRHWSWTARGRACEQQGQDSWAARGRPARGPARRRSGGWDAGAAAPGAQWAAMAEVASMRQNCARAQRGHGAGSETRLRPPWARTGRPWRRWRA